MEIEIRDLVYIGVNCALLFGFYLKIEKRLTHIETVVEIIKKNINFDKN